MPAVPVDQRHNGRITLLGVPAEQERRPHVELEVLGEVVLSPPA